MLRHECGSNVALVDLRPLMPDLVFHSALAVADFETRRVMKLLGSAGGFETRRVIKLLGSAGGGGVVTRTHPPVGSGAADLRQ